MPGLIFLTILLFLVIFLSGYRLSRSGKPYGTLLLTIHKLISVGALVYLAITVFKTESLSTSALMVSILAGLSFLLLVASGGVISAAKEPPAWVKLAHKVLPYLCILATAGALYLILVSKL
jgi:hypothetical protein